MKTRIISLNDHDTRLLVQEGDGPALLFLHGFPEHCGAWEEVLASLSGFQCFAPDQRGYGTSYRPNEIEAYAARHLARDILDLIGVLNLESVHLIGHDWGASVAYAVAFGHDPRVASLTILNGVHPIPFQKALAAGGAQTEASQYIPKLRREGAEAVLTANDFARLASLFEANMDMSWLTGARLDAYRDAWHSEATVRAMVNWYRASPLVVPKPGAPLPPDQMPGWLPERMQIRVPHLLIWGMGDTALLPESWEGLDAFCTDLTIHEITDADHWLHHQKPDQVAALIRDFVTMVDRTQV